MFLNYFRVAIRQLWRNKLFSAFNIFGLATSMSVCLIVILLLQDQLNYDSFHADGDRIYKVISGSSNQENFQADMSTAPLDLAPELRDNYDFVEESTMLIPLDGFFRQELEELPINQGGFVVEPDFFDMFDFGWSREQGVEALMQPASLVITQQTADNWFPEGNAVGQRVTVDILGDFTITGVIPTPPRRSHIQFEYLIGLPAIEALTDETRGHLSLSRDHFRNVWRGHVYFKVAPTTSQDQINEQLAGLANEYNEQDEEAYLTFTSQTLADVMPSRSYGNEIGVGTPWPVIIFIFTIGVIILLTACFNYTNLTLARSLQRAREIGVRKVAGATKRNVIAQFLTESVLVAFLSLIVAIALLEILIPAFYSLHPFVEEVFYLDRPWFTYPVFFLFSLLVGILAGVLPSWSISKLRPIHAMSNLKNTRLFARMGLRKALITFQFALALICILAVTIIIEQRDHVLDADLGININNHATVIMYDANYEVFAQQVREIPGVKAVGSINRIMFTGANETQASYNDGQDSMKLEYWKVSDNFAENLEIELLAGEAFPPVTNEKEQFVILNETAIERLGYEQPAAAIGQFITVDSSNLQITGVAKDFHYRNIWSVPIGPFALRQLPGAPRMASVQFEEDFDRSAVAAMRGVWNDMSPDRPMSAIFTREGVFYMTRFFQMGSRIIGFIGFLAILISCLGLLGTVMYSMEGRLKEIGIRKVLGASIQHLTWLLSKGFLVLLTIAIVVSIPIVLTLSNWWLNFFYLRTTITWWLPLVGVAITLFIGLIVILPQTYWTANRNPAETLKTE